MLKEFKGKEPIVYLQMQNALNGGLSHAYLFNINGNIYGEEMVLAFVKNIICKEHENKMDYDECITCKRIDNNNFSDLKKIYPDGLWIKKEQIDELQIGLSTKSLETNKRIYIIYEAEKLNKQSANSLLKFIEEPKDGIIAILLTNNINLIMDTISSRCQTITFNKNKVEDFVMAKGIKENVTIKKILYSVFKNDNIESISDENVSLLNNVIKFIRYYEINGTKTILCIKEYFSTYFEDKRSLLNAFECMILFYRDVLGYKLSNRVLYYDDQIELIKKTAKNNSIKRLLKKLDLIIGSEKMIKNNANINLLIDKMIIEMEEHYD